MVVESRLLRPDFAMSSCEPKPRANSVCGFKGEVTEALGCEALGCRSKLGDGAAVIVWSVGSLFR